MMSVRNGWRVRLWSLTLLLGIATPASAQLSQPESGQWNAAERQAVEVAERWIAGWTEQNLDKIASTMSEDVEYRLDPSQAAKRGRDALMADIKPLLPMMTAMSVWQEHAVGSDFNVTVLIERVDHFVLKGFPMQIPVATVFRVQHGKIVQLLDIPMIDLGADAGGPPPQ